MTPLISVIVPVFQAEKYLDACIKSILNQTYTHLELLLINDGSHDQSAEICKHYLQKDSRICYYEHENHGVSYTRNIGIKYAQGEYIAFIDSDDYISPDFLMKLYDCIKNSNNRISTLSFCKLSLLTHTTNVTKEEILPNYTQKKDSFYDIYLEKLITRKIHGSCSRTLFPTKIIHDYNIQFTPCKIAEDLLFLIEVLLHCEEIIVCDEPLYIYRQFQQSSSHSSYMKNYLEDRILYIKKLNSILKSASLKPQEYEWLMAFSFQFYRMLLYMNATASENFKKELKTLDASIFNKKTIVPKPYEKKFYQLLSKKHRVLYLLTKYRLYFLIRWIRSEKRK